MKSRSVRAYADVALGRQRSPAHDTGPHMVRYLRAANVKDGVLDLTDVKEMNFNPKEQAIFSLRPGDVLVTEGSGSITAVGASSVWNGEIDGTVCFQNTVLRLRPRPVTDGRFLAWWCRHAFADGLFASAATGANIYHLSVERVRGLPMAHIPLEEQRAIADYLDAETARIDALIAKKQQLVHLLEERNAALVDAYFSPRHGESTVRLARLATVQTGVTLNASKANDGTTARMPYLRVANVQPGWLDLSEVKEVDVEPSAAARSMLRVGDVLMTEGGDIDKLGRGTVWRGEIENCLHQNHVFAVRPRPGQLDPDFLANVTRTSHARAYFESTGVQSTNLASTNSFKVADFRIPALNLETQRVRSAAFERLVQPLSDSAAKLRRQIGLLAEHRQALITAVVTGEFRVASVA